MRPVTPAAAVLFGTYGSSACGIWTSCQCVTCIGVCGLSKHYLACKGAVEGKGLGFEPLADCEHITPLWWHAPSRRHLLQLPCQYPAAKVSCKINCSALKPSTGVLTCA